MTRLLVITLLALSIWPASAPGKEISSVKVCGADACRHLDGAAARGLENGGPISGPPKQPAGFYTVEVSMEMGNAKPETFTTVYVPASHMLRGGDGSWMTMPREARRPYDRAVHGLAAFPASELDMTGTEPPSAIVDEVFDPARAAAQTDEEGSSLPAAAIALGAVALLGAAVAVESWWR